MTTRTTTTPDDRAFAAPIGLSAFLLFTVEPLIGGSRCRSSVARRRSGRRSCSSSRPSCSSGYLYAHLSVYAARPLGAIVHLVLVRGSGWEPCSSPRRTVRATCGTAATAGPRPVLRPPGADHRPAGLRPHDDHAARARAGSPRAGPTGAGGDPVLAVRPEQRRLAARPARLSVRSSSRASGSPPSAASGLLGSRSLVGCWRSPRCRAMPAIAAPSGRAPPPAPSPRPVTSMPAQRIAWRAARSAGSCWPPSRPACSRRSRPSSRRTSCRRRSCGSSPLAIYLASFIVAFSPRGGSWSVRAAWSPRPLHHPAVGPVRLGRGLADPRRSSPLELVGLRLVAVALHGRLALDRPDAGPPDRVLPRPLDRRRARQRLRRPRRAALPGCLGVPDPARRGAPRARPVDPARRDRRAERAAGARGLDFSPVRRRRRRPDAAVPRRRRACWPSAWSDATRSVTRPGSAGSSSAA